MDEQSLPQVVDIAGEEIAVRMPVDAEADGPRHEVKLPDAPAREERWWTALFLAFLHRYTAGERFYLAGTRDGGLDPRCFAVSGQETVAAVADRVSTVLAEPPAPVRVSGRVPVVAGLPAACEAYGDAVDIHLAVGGAGVTLCANGALWTVETIERMAGHLATMARAAGGGAQIADLPMLTPAERRTMLVDWNATAVTWPETDYLSLLRRPMTERPDSPAVVQAGRTTTFGELDSQSNRIARRLQKMGAGPGERIGVLCPRSAEYVIAAVGVLKTGAAVVPLDPANPDARLTHMIADAAPLAVITTDALRYRVPDTAPSIRFGGPEFRDEPDEPVTATITGDTISHLIYTSGSTGRPKAVLERHAALANLVYWTERAYAVRPGDRASWLTAPGFGVQIIEWLPYLALGVPIHIGDAANPTPDEVRGWLQEQGVTHSLLVSAMAERVWSGQWPADTPMRVMVATAERVNEWPPTGLPFKAVVTYGSTETTNVLSCLDLGVGLDVTPDATPASVRANRPVPGGRPMSNVRVYLLDPAGNPVPVGVVGRLHVAGTGLSAGYNRDPEMTATKFRPNTLPEEPGDVLYDTGDLARFRTDGTIEVLGRSGAQINIRGFRVELGEVEAAVRAVPGVDEAVVVAHEPAPGDVWLVAYLGAGGDAPTAAAVRASVGERLPHYMVPGIVVILDALPRLPNGKVDRRGLPAPDTLPAAEGEPAVAQPENPVEKELARIWSTLFRREQIGVTDHFFELGGHSLLAFRLIGAVRESFEVEVSLPDLWAHPTIRDLTGLIADRREVV